MSACSKLSTASSSLTTHVRTFTCLATTTTTTTRVVPHPPDLVKWVKQQGGFVHQAVKITTLDDNNKGLGLGLGLVAFEDIPKGSDLIVLPNHIPLKFDANDAVLLHLATKVPEELWVMKLGLKLLQERAKVGSFWWSYISNLPETYTVPIFFPGEDIKNLQYAPLLHQINKRCRFLLDFDKEVKNTLQNLKPNHHPFGGQDVDASSLGWAMSAVSSRAFRLHGQKLSDGTRSNVPMMLPLIDMCNHSFDPNARIIQEQDPTDSNMLIKVVAESTIKQNDSLFLNYGPLNNDLLLLDYGFVSDSNPNDCIELRYDGALLDAASMASGVSAPNFSAPAPWQQQILSQLNLVGEAPDLKVILGGAESVDGRLLAALRVLLSGDEESVQKLDLNTLKSLSAEAPLGIATEIASLRTIIALCVIALDHFPTKIMDDEALLKKGVSGSTELAIRFRVQKKYMIVDLMRLLQRTVKSLSSKEANVSQG
ncbi:hypothetical protein ACFE04_020430 [Oxalis oulophora]